MKQGKSFLDFVLGIMKIIVFRHELPRIKKESFYQLFREIVFASSEDGLMIARQVLAVECTHSKFLNFIDKMYRNIPLWCLYYR